MLGEMLRFGGNCKSYDDRDVFVSAGAHYCAAPPQFVFVCRSLLGFSERRTSAPLDSVESSPTLRLVIIICMWSASYDPAALSLVD